MPADKRLRASSTPPPSTGEGEKSDDSLLSNENCNEEQLEDAAGSDGSSDSSDGEQDEFVLVNMADIRKEFQCPICLGIIRKTRTVMECLHRFCRECIDKAMRLGKNECPACRTHCASRRSLRDDPNYDALIAALYPDIDKYEEEELALHADEKDLNNQLQASINQTFQRQAEATGKKRPPARAGSASAARRQGNRRNLRRGKGPCVVYNESDEEEDTNENSSADEHRAQVKSRRRKRRSSTRASQPSAGRNADGNDSGENGEQFLAWGRGGARSSNRHSGPAWANSGKSSRSDKVSKLVNRLQHAHENYEMKITVMLVPLRGETIPCLQRPYLCCSPGLSVGHLCEFVSMHVRVDAYKIEMLIVQDMHPVIHSEIFQEEGSTLSPPLSKMRVLNEDQTLAEIQAKYAQPNLVFAYRRKVPTIFWL